MFAIVTVVPRLVAARGLRIDASFTKQLPLKHEYMQTFVKHQAEFGGANRVLIALVARDGNMFTPGFFDALKKATDEVLVMDGIDRGRVQSLFTPNVRYMEVVEDGIEAGNVVDSEFVPTPKRWTRCARTSSRPASAAASSPTISPARWSRPSFSRRTPPASRSIPSRSRAMLEERVRDKIQGNDVVVRCIARRQGRGIDVHMIGFAKVVGDIADGAMSVIVFAIVTILLTLLAVWYYVQSLKVAVVPIVCSHRRGHLAARHAGAARLRHRSSRAARAVPDLRDRRVARRAEDQRREGSRGRGRGQHGRGAPDVPAAAHAGASSRCSRISSVSSPSC